MIHSYPWYIADWRNSETRLNLTLEERALYRELLDFCYSERSLTTDERTIARIANCSDQEFQRCWPKVKSLFNEANGRYTHKKVTEVLEKLDGYHEQKRQAGIASGERRRNARSTDVRPPLGVSLPKKATENEPTTTSSSTTTNTEAVHTHSSTVLPEKIPFVRAPRGPVAADLNGHTSQRFGEFWDRYPRQQRKDAACRQWVSTVDIDSEGAVFACLERYLASDEVSRGVVANPDKWLYEQHHEHWGGTWPGLKLAGPPKKESKSAMLERVLNDDTGST